jgi:hypothetical protein
VISVTSVVDVEIETPPANALDSQFQRLVLLFLKVICNHETAKPRRIPFEMRV